MSFGKFYFRATLLTATVPYLKPANYDPENYNDVLAFELIKIQNAGAEAWATSYFSGNALYGSRKKLSTPSQMFAF